MCCSLAGKTANLCPCAHCFLRLNAPLYFLLDDIALLQSTVAGIYGQTKEFRVIQAI